MKINPININNNFKGAAEAKLFRQDAKTLIQDIDAMDGDILKYTKVDAESDALSIQARMRKILFVDVPKVGSDYATSDDYNNLKILKKKYVELEKEQSFIETMKDGAGRFIDRSEEVADIKF